MARRPGTIWAKSIVFQWNADGSEFSELNFGGSGTNDNNGTAGDMTTVETALTQLAPIFGFDPTDTANYNLHYRNPVLSHLTAERLQIIYANRGLEGVKKQLQLLRWNGTI